MADAKRQFELMLLRLVPHALRDDFMTVGVVVVEPGGEFADARFTRDWKRVQCFAPDLELEILESLEATVRAELKKIRGREDVLQLLEERFGAVVDVAPVKGLLAQDPVAEMQVLERDHLAPQQAAERAPRLGRLGLVRQMETVFAEEGVLELLQRDLDMSEFTGESDPFTVDFGFRVGRSLKLFHALALNLSRDPAVMLAYRYSRIHAGLGARGEEALMTAIVSDDALRAEGDVASGIAMLKTNEIAVRGVGEMTEIAGEVRRELRA